MTALEYRTGDLFSASPSAILAHACNAKGVWGSGVAKRFKQLYPHAFRQYSHYCCYTDPSVSVGTCPMVKEDGRRIACLITSDGFGRDLGTEQSILDATRASFILLMENLHKKDEVHMPKINSGLFRVPWGKTAAVLEDVLREFTNTVVVWELPVTN